MQKEEELGLASQTRSHMTIATSFRFSLMDLMSKLLGGELHFVRCVKPNDFGVPEQFDHIKVITLFMCQHIINIACVVSLKTCESTTQ